MKILVAKKINPNKASDRIRISKWLDEFDRIIYWENAFALFWIIFSKWKSRKIFLLSKEFNIFGILIVLIGSFNNQTRTIFDVCDLFILKKKLSLRERLNKYFVELILIKVDLVIASSVELKKTIQNFYGRNKVIIIEDELEFEFLPSSCSIKKQDYLCIGWFGNSGYLSHKKVKSFSQRELRINSSLNLISKIIKKNIDLKTKTKFILLTNHLKQVSKYLSRYLGDNYIEYVCIEKYNIFNIEKFFSSIDKLLITYGDDSFSRTKSTNRVDTGLWLVKEVHVLNNPYNWNNSKIDTTNFVVESQELNECFSKISNNNYEIQYNRDYYFEYIISKTNENKHKRKMILKDIWNENNFKKLKLKN